MTTLTSRFGVGNTLTVLPCSGGHWQVTAKSAMSGHSVTATVPRREFLEALGAVSKEEYDAVADRARFAERRVVEEQVRTYAERQRADEAEAHLDERNAKIEHLEGELSATKANRAHGFESLRARAEWAEERAEKAEAELADLKVHDNAVVSDQTRRLGIIDLKLAHAERRAEAAEATLAKVREELGNHPVPCDEHAEDDVVKCGWKRAVAGIHDILNPPKPFEPPTEIPARVEAKRRSTGHAHVFYLWINGTGAINDNLWIDENDWNRALTAGQFMDYYTDHRVIGEDTNHG